MTLVRSLLPESLLKSGNKLELMVRSLSFFIVICDANNLRTTLITLVSVLKGFGDDALLTL